MLAEFASRSMFAALLHPWRAWSRFSLSERHGGDTAGPSIMSSRDDDSTPLLIERMLALHLEPEDVRGADPSMFGEFQALCRMCESQGQCAWSLVHDGVDPAWQDWRNYCPNSAQLRMLSVLGTCAFDAEE